MTHHNHALQRRFGDQVPGMQLLAIEQAALPVTVVQVDLLAQERKRLPIVEEFVLRFVEQGVTDPSEIAGLMGLEPVHVTHAAAAQISENNLTRKGGHPGLILTAQGREVAKTMAATQPVYMQLPLVFDRLTWRATNYSRDLLLSKREAQEQGLVLLPASKKARVNLDDITVADFNALILRREGKRRRLDVLQIRKVKPRNHKYFPVQLLVYGDLDSQEINLAVYVDDQLSETHAFGLAEAHAVEKLGLSLAEGEPRPLLDEDLEAQRVSAPAEAGAAAHGETGAGQPPQADPDVYVRSLSVFEHPQLLSEAFDRHVGAFSLSPHGLRPVSSVLISSYIWSDV